MSDQEVKPLPGYYSAKIVNYGVRPTKAGEPNIVIMFEVTADGAPQRVGWRGSLKEGLGRDITLKALSVCGFVNYKQFHLLADGPKSNLLDMKKSVQVVVEHEKATDGTDKKFAKVRWINEEGGGKFKDAMDSANAKVLMEGMGLEADFLRIANENGLKVSSETKLEASPFNEVANLEDIPF